MYNCEFSRVTKKKLQPPPPLYRSLWQQERSHSYFIHTTYFHQRKPQNCLDLRRCCLIIAIVWLLATNKNRSTIHTGSRERQRYRARSRPDNLRMRNTERLKAVERLAKKPHTVHKPRRTKTKEHSYTPVYPISNCLKDRVSV